MTNKKVLNQYLLFLGYSVTQLIVRAKFLTLSLYLFLQWQSSRFFLSLKNKRKENKHQPACITIHRSLCAQSNQVIIIVQPPHLSKGIAWFMDGKTYNKDCFKKKYNKEMSNVIFSYFLVFFYYFTKKVLNKK